MKTPLEIAQQTLTDHAIQPQWQRSGAQILGLIAEAVEADRAEFRNRPSPATAARAVDELIRCAASERFWQDNGTYGDDRLDQARKNLRRARAEVMALVG